MALVALFNSAAGGEPAQSPPCSRSRGISANGTDYLFGFNNPWFSDRVLVLVSEYSTDSLAPSEAGQAGGQHEGSPTSNDTDDMEDTEMRASASAGGSDSSPEREHVSSMSSSSSSSSHTQRHPRHAHMSHPHSHSHAAHAHTYASPSARSHEPAEGSPPRALSRSPSARDPSEEAEAGGGSTPMSDDNSPSTCASASSSSNSAATPHTMPRVTTRRASSARSHSSGSGNGAVPSSSNSGSNASSACASPPNVQVNSAAASNSSAVASSSTSSTNTGGGALAVSSSSSSSSSNEAATGGGTTPTTTTTMPPAVGLTTPPPHSSSSSHHRHCHGSGSGGGGQRRSMKRNLPTPSRAVTRNMARKTDRKQSVRSAQKRETLHSRGSSSRHRNTDDNDEDDVKHLSRAHQGGVGSSSGRRPPPSSSSAFSLDMEDDNEGDSLWVSSLLLSGHSPFFKRLFNGPEHMPHHARSGSHGRSGSRYGQGGDSYAYGESGSQSMMHSRSTPHSRGSLLTFKDNDTYSVELIVSPAQRAMFKLVIKFMYSERNSDDIVHAGMPAKDILDFLFMADKYQVHAAVCKALVVLSRIPLSLGLCETLLKLPPNLRNSNLTNPSYTELHKKMQDYLVSEFKQFDNVYTSTKFKELSVEALTLVLSSSKLSLRSENTVWRAVHIWLRYKPATREFTPALIECIRFPMMHLDFLLDVVQKSSDCFDVVGLDTCVNAAVSFLASSRSKPRQEQIRKADKSDRFSPRTPSNEAYVYHGKFRREDIQNLEVGKPIYSDKFLVDGYEFLIKLRKVPQQGTFGVYLGAYHEIPDSRNKAKHLEVTARFSFAAKVAATGQDSDYRPLHRQVTHKFLPRPGHNTSWGYNDILGMQWDDIFTGSSEYFHDNLFNLRVEISVLADPPRGSAEETAAAAAAAV